MLSTKKVYLGFGGLLVALGALVALNVTGTSTGAVSSYRDCADDTIIRCGAVTEAELLQKYDANVGDVKNIYSHYGISRGDLAGQTSQIKHGTVYQDGRVVVDGKTVATNAYSLSRLPFYDSAGRAPRVVYINGVKLYEGPNMSIFVRPVDAYVYMRNGQFYKAILSACGNPLMATPSTPPTPPKPQPVYSCDTLKATRIDRTRFSFAVAATAKDGAQIVSYTYDFGDSSKQTTTASTVSHTYAKPGKYTARVTANIKVGTETKAVTGTNCQTTVTVEEAPKAPVYTCDSLKASKIERTKFGFTAAATAANGAQIVSYTYDFGDSSKQTTTSKTTTHTYAKPGKYTAKLTVSFKINDQAKAVTSTNCQTTITVEEAPKTPVYSCDSLKATKIERTQFGFTTSATATNGAQIVSYTYDFGDSQKLTTTNKTVEHTYVKPGKYTAKVTVNVKVNNQTKAVTGTNCQTTITVEEAPKTPVYKCESLKAEKINRTTFRFTTTAIAENGAVITNYSYNFGDNKTTNTSASSVEHEYAKAGKYTAKVTLTVKVNGENKLVTSTNCQTTVTVEEAPKAPVYLCDSLKANKIERTQFGFTAAATAEKAEIVSYNYDFGDGKKLTTTDKTVEHEYAKPGKYTATLSVNVKVDGSSKVVTGTNCKTTVTVEEAPKTPIYKCDSLTAQLIKTKDNTFAYTLKYTAEGGATLTKVTYDFGDKTTKTFDAKDATKVEHTFEKPGTYTTTATLHFTITSVKGNYEKTDVCETKVTVPAPDMCDVPGKENLPKDSPECKEEKCDLPGKEDLPKDSDQCVETPVTPETPPELPKTGLETFVGGGLGLGSLTAAGYYWIASKRNLVSALLNK